MNMMRLSSFILLALAIIQLANADIYQCKRANGSIEFSDSVCHMGGVIEKQYEYSRPAQQQSQYNASGQNQNLDSAARKLGFKDYSQYQQSNKICLELYNQYVTYRMNAVSCGTSMECLKRQATQMSVYSNAMINSPQWKNNKCDVVAQVEAKSHGSASGEYEIEVSHNDELFIINGEKFKAKTYCFNMNQGDRVIFIEGSALGACASATLVNMRTKNKCDVWCE